MEEKEKNRYWLLKTEPREWAWSNQCANDGVSNWDGVKNKQAQNNLKAMKLHDLCFFYHSGHGYREIVGVVAVVKEWYQDGGGQGAVDVKAIGKMKTHVSLDQLRRMQIDGFALIKQPRLSVVPVPEDVWHKICLLGGGFVGDDANSPCECA